MVSSRAGAPGTRLENDVVTTLPETVPTPGRPKRRRKFAIASAVAVAAIAVVAVKRWQSELFFYRHQVQLWPNPDPIDGSSSYLNYPIEFAPDGRVAIAKDNRDRILILDPSAGRIARIVSDGGDKLVDSLAFAKDGKSIVSAGWVGQVNVWDASTGVLLRTFRLTNKTPVVERNGSGITTTYRCSDVLVSRDGTKVLWRDDGKKLLQIWNVTTGRPERMLPGLADQNVLALSSGANLVALCDSSHKVSLRDVRKPAGRPLFDARPGFPVNASFSPDENVIATACGQDIQLWDTRTGSRLRAISLPKQVPLDADVTRFAFSLDGTTLAAGAKWRVDTWLNVVLGKSELWRESRGCVALWKVATGDPIDAVYPKSDALVIALSPAADLLVAGSWSGTMTLWQRRLRSTQLARDTPAAGKKKLR
jgi:WD40 repeat protein